MRYVVYLLGSVIISLVAWMEFGESFFAGYFTSLGILGSMFLTDSIIDEKEE